MIFNKEAYISTCVLGARSQKNAGNVFDYHCCASLDTISRYSYSKILHMDEKLLILFVQRSCIN